MKSVFAPPSFGRPQMGITPMSPASAVRMGVEWGDILDDIGLSDVENLLEEIDTVLADVPLGTLRDEYEARRAECMTKSLVSKWSCLYELFQDIKRDIREGRHEQQPAPPPPAPAPQPQPENGFPVVPVAIGGVVVAVVIYALVR